jgi:hypothetical protein
MSYIRIFSDEEGETHFEDVKIELESVERDYSDVDIKLSSVDPALEYAFFVFFRIRYRLASSLTECYVGHSIWGDGGTSE